MTSPIRGLGRPGAYKLADGTRVPSVTTITSNWKPGVEGLLIWANRLGQEGKDHREERDKAAGAGTLAHLLVENAIHGDEPTRGIDLGTTDPDLLSKAQMGYQAYESWKKVMGIEYLATEIPLVSEEHAFGGTIDAIARNKDGAIGVYDWKSGSSVRPEMLFQVSAYSKLWNEHYQDQSTTQIYILRFGKEMGDFHFHSWPMQVIEEAWRGFLMLRELYSINKMLQKVAS